MVFPTGRQVHTTHGLISQSTSDAVLVETRIRGMGDAPAARPRCGKLGDGSLAQAQMVPWIITLVICIYVYILVVYFGMVRARIKVVHRGLQLHIIQNRV